MVNTDQNKTKLGLIKNSGYEFIPFECQYCGEKRSLIDVVSKNGIFFLFGKIDGYYGTTCPKCHKTSHYLMKHKDIMHFKKRLSFEVSFSSISDGKLLIYDSFNYSLDFDIHSTFYYDSIHHKQITDNNCSIQEIEVPISMRTSKICKDTYCSYEFNDVAMGPKTAVLWFKKSLIDILVMRENSENIMIFPRYFLYDEKQVLMKNQVIKEIHKLALYDNVELNAFPEYQDIHKINKYILVLESILLAIDNLQIERTENEGPKKLFRHILKEIDREASDSYLQLIIMETSDQLTEHLNYLLNIRKQHNSYQINDLYCFAKDLMKIFESRKSIIDNGIEKPYIDLSNSYKIFLDNMELETNDDTISIDCKLNGLDDYFKEDKFNHIELFSILATINLHLSDFCLDMHNEQIDIDNESMYDDECCLSFDDDWFNKDDMTDDDWRINDYMLDDVVECDLSLEHDWCGDDGSDINISILKSQADKKYSSFGKIITANIDTIELKDKVAEMAQFNADILILGETGTGKELFAKAIHQASGRAGNFVPLNCSSIPQNLFETELFGHRKGAFSGAFFEKKGAFEYADKGTLFLDEIGEMPLELQAKILRAVEYRTITRIGCVKPIHVDIKIVFATNRDLKKEVDENRFRKDLFFRIFSPSFRILPLRERIEDIPILVDHFVRLFNKKFNKSVKSVSSDLLNHFRHYVWDGNVRELMKVIEMGVINSSGTIITEKEITQIYDFCRLPKDTNKDPDIPPATKVTDDEIKYWMKRLDNNKSQVAQRLGVTYRTILRRTKKICQQ